jgi:hypothetical protein
MNAQADIVFQQICVQAFKDGKRMHLCIFFTLWEQGKWDDSTRRHAYTHFTPHWTPRKAFKIHRTEIYFNAGFVNGFDKVLQGVSANS